MKIKEIVHQIVSKDTGKSINLIIEMAIPTDPIRKMTFWHGTPTETIGKNILKNGLKVSEVESKSALTPVKGANYVTPDIKYALIYGMGGSYPLGSAEAERDIQRYGENFYLFKISGEKLVDIQPDEDSIGELIWSGRGPSWLISLAKKHLTENIYSKVKSGEYVYWARAGKKLVKKMTDSQKIDLIFNYGTHVANFGVIYPDMAYKISRKDIKNMNPDGYNILDFAKTVANVVKK